MGLFWDIANDISLGKMHGELNKKVQAAITNFCVQTNIESVLFFSGIHLKVTATNYFSIIKVYWLTISLSFFQHINNVITSI